MNRQEVVKQCRQLRFGTSGLRDRVEYMTDMECYINTRGFILFLRERGEIDDVNKSIALAGDLRSSTSRIMTAVHQAIEDAGCSTLFCGKVPTPTLAYYASENNVPGIMVTGSHIPDDRNGIKFTKTSGEVLKTDEADILRNVAGAREEEYAKDEQGTVFDDTGMFKESRVLPEAEFESEAIGMYVNRYSQVFINKPLTGQKIVLYQHSAVGRDIEKEIFEGLGGEVIAVERSDIFVPVDTEKVSADTIDILKKSAEKYKPFAVISTDGDSDRPLLADENGDFLTGDKLGALVSMFLEPDFAAVPISANDAVVSSLTQRGVKVKQTKIGSPYVIAAMNEELMKESSEKVVSWESNGGFLLGSDWNIEQETLKALPTRDAALPLIAVMLLAEKEDKTISELIKTSLPERYTHADVIDDKTSGCEKYTAEMGKIIIGMFSPKEQSIEQADFTQDGVKVAGEIPEGGTVSELEAIKEKLSRYFTAARGFGNIISINFIDGIRIAFTGGKVAHLRPSGNAPEFRMYATADTQEEADRIVETKNEIIPEIIGDLVT